MPPILDFSSAVPWLGSGFLAGLLLFWLFRAISGIDRRRIEALNAANGDLEQARRAHASLSQNYAQLEGERARLASESSQLTQRAALLPQYEQQLAQLQTADSTKASALEAANAELDALRTEAEQEFSKLRQQSEQAAGTAKYYETEFARLLEAHQELSKDSAAKAELAAKFQTDAEVASRAASETTRLRSDIAAAKAEIESLRDDVKNAKASEGRYQDEIGRLRREHEQAVVAVETAKSAGAGVNDEVTRLKSELAAAQKRAENNDEVLRLNAEIARLKPLEDERLRHAAEIEQLRAEVAASRDVSAGGDAHNLSEELNRLKASSGAEAASYVEEIERLKSEMTKLNAALASARSDERNAAMELHAAKNDLQQARIAMEETSRLVAERHAEIDQLKGKLASMPADVDNYRRFKEALDAANRIASGLPEKT